MNAADPADVKAILDACAERDDPRLLARFAFGITSPRLTALKCSTSHPLFGSMVNVDFRVLVQAFEDECKKCDYKKAETVITSSQVKKRTYSQANSGSSAGSTRGRGSGRGNSRGGFRASKRGRY